MKRKFVEQAKLNMDRSQQQLHSGEVTVYDRRKIMIKCIYNRGCSDAVDYMYSSGVKAAGLTTGRQTRVTNLKLRGEGLMQKGDVEGASMSFLEAAQAGRLTVRSA